MACLSACEDQKYSLHGVLGFYSSGHAGLTLFTTPFQQLTKTTLSVGSQIPHSPVSNGAIDSPNQTLKIAEANFRQARAATRFNRSFEAPTIGAAPNISALRDSANQPYFPTDLANNGTGDFTLPVDLSWEIDPWGRIRRSVTAAREQAQASAADMAAGS